ncbi:MAG: MutS-related protein [Candidatus Binataceae bacterium]
MKAFLMYRDREFDVKQQLPPNEAELTQDLELNRLYNAMALGDKDLFEIARKVILSSATDLGTILYRQSVLRDCLVNSSVIKSIYSKAVEAIVREKRESWWLSNKDPGLIVHRSINLLEIFRGLLGELRSIADEHADEFKSEGLIAFFAMLKRELSDEFLATLQNYLKQLAFRDGVLISAELGQGLKGNNYVLRWPQDTKQSWVSRVFAQRPRAYTFHLHPRDNSGFESLGELKDRGLNLVASTLAQSCDHVLNFFRALRSELAFYLGCLNLYEQLRRKGEPTCFPVPIASDERRHAFKGLYDVCLTLSMEQRVVGNDVRAENKELVIITGANQGGKSTFLRSLGVAQLMMQCGMFVPAESFCANVCDHLFTHYKREEDVTMKSGKLDEELARMSEIVDHLTPNSMVLFNESFAATNEREGSEIARQIISALLERRIKVFFVTHLYECAHAFHDRMTENAIFLRAERQPDGGRSFRLVEGEPLQTSYGEDLYERIFNPNRAPRDRSRTALLSPRA